MKINEKTLIPISLVITIILASLWFGGISSQVSAHEKQLESLNSEEDGSIKFLLRKQGEALARIEGFLETKKEQ